MSRVTYIGDDVTGVRSSDARDAGAAVATASDDARDAAAAVASDDARDVVAEEDVDAAAQ